MSASNIASSSSATARPPTPHEGADAFVIRFNNAFNTLSHAHTVLVAAETSDRRRSLLIDFGDFLVSPPLFFLYSSFVDLFSR
jgi:hypothetical protein